MCRSAVIAAAAAIAAGVGINAQDKAMDKMPMKAKEMTYTGCVDRSATGQFSLTHAMGGDAMKMSKDKMAHDMDKKPMVMTALSREYLRSRS